MIRPAGSRIAEWEASLTASAREHLLTAVDRIAEAKSRGRKVVVATGSGPNIHEGVTTLIAEMIHKGAVDGVLTSSAVVAHEMAGTLDRVHRIQGFPGLPLNLLPRGGMFEITVLAEEDRSALRSEMPDGWDLYDRAAALPGDDIIKAAGNLAWPMGPRTERLAREAERVAKRHGLPFERVVGAGADPRTMIGAGAARGCPVLVSTPQLVGGGAVGMAIGDALSITARSRLVRQVLAGASVIVESAIALSQEIHDGPYETYTGHGIWAGWTGGETYSLEGKTLVRIDLDPNLERAWRAERENAAVQQAVDRGLPKTKLTGIPFRMEMSGFARLEGSLPVTADIGVAWPVLAARLEERLGLRFDYLSAPQETPEGGQMRRRIADQVRPVDRAKMLKTYP